MLDVLFLQANCVYIEIYIYIGWLCDNPFVPMACRAQLCYAISIYMNIFAYVETYRWCQLSDYLYILHDTTNQIYTKGPLVDTNGSWHSFLKPSRIHSTYGSPAGLGSLAGHIFWYHAKLYQPLHSSILLYVYIYTYNIYVYIYDMIHAYVHVPFHVRKHLTCHYTCPYPEPRRCEDCGCEDGTMMQRACERCAAVPQLLLVLMHCQNIDMQCGI